MNRKDGRTVISEGGFTLLEVMVSIFIASVAVIAVIKALSGGLSLARSASDSTEAVLRANELMNGILLEKEIEEGALAGEGEGYSWDAEITPFDNDMTEEDPGVRVYRITIRVEDQAKKSRYTITALKTITGTGDGEAL